MSLNWSMKGVAFDWKCKGVELDMGGYRYPEGDEAFEMFVGPITESLIWATMIVGAIPADEANTAKFAKRVRAWEIARGPMVRQPRDVSKALLAGAIRSDSFTPEGYLSRAELLRHKGMSTNAPKLTDNQFETKLAKLILEAATWQLSREIA